jgi:protein-S-isoprenylcysteine O-methyltransferase Ste14
VTLRRLRVPTGFAVALTALYIADPGPVSIAAGTPIALAGLLFRASAAGVIRKNRELATEGPYRMTRNPLYFGSFLLTLGFAVMAWRIPAALLLLVPFGAIYAGVIRQEERDLEARFRDRFARFRAEVPAFFPRRLRAGLLKSFSLDQYMANREYNAALGFLAAIATLLAKVFWAI